LNGFQEDCEDDGATFEARLQDGTTDSQLLFECPYPGCDHSFTYKGNLNVHQRKKHGGVYGSDQQMTFFCRVPNCGRSFYSRGALAKHQSCIHFKNYLSGYDGQT